MTLQRVLVVEDDADIRKVAQLALEAVGGLTVRLCADGREALAVAPEYAPQLILLDVMMPDMDGIATIHALRARPDLADIPVIFMTAKVQAADLQRYVDLGAIGTITKPFDPMQLADDVRRLWRAAVAMP